MIYANPNKSSRKKWTNSLEFLKNYQRGAALGDTEIRKHQKSGIYSGNFGLLVIVC